MRSPAHPGSGAGSGWEQLAESEMDGGGPGHTVEALMTGRVPTSNRLPPARDPRVKSLTDTPRTRVRLCMMNRSSFWPRAVAGATLMLAWTCAAAEPTASSASSASPVSTQPAPAAETATVSADEQALLTGHVQLTSREVFLKAGEAYFDHQSPPRWIVFQAVPALGSSDTDKPSDPNPFYAMFVARLIYDDSASPADSSKPAAPSAPGAQPRILGIETPLLVSPDHSANTCGWFHPAQPWRVLFGSTLVAPSKSEKPGYQRGSSRYVWQFPDEMEIVERAVSATLADLPKDHPHRAEYERYTALGDAHGERLKMLRKQGKTDELLKASDEFRLKLDEQCPTFRAAKTWTGAKALFEQPLYDAECSWSNDGRFVLYAKSKPTDTPRPEVDIAVYDTKTKKHHDLVVQPGYDGGPFFSPNGRFICYRSDRAGNDLLQIYIAELAFDADGVPTGIKREKALTANEHVNWGPFWHPSGSLIVYATSQVGHSNYEVFAIEATQDAASSLWDAPANTIRSRRITHTSGADVLPSFSADGHFMMWTCQRGPKAEGESKPSSQVWVAELTDVWSGTKFDSARLDAFFASASPVPTPATTTPNGAKPEGGTREQPSK